MEECGDGSEQEEQGGDWREDEECGGGRMQQAEEQRQGGVLGRRRWRCSHRCGWSSRYRAAGWSWVYCGGEEEEQEQEQAVVWEPRRRRCL